MKKPNLSLKSRSPFKKGSNDLDTQVEYFHKAITKVIDKNSLKPEDELVDFMQKELAKCKDGIDTWIKSTALDQLGYTEWGNLFKQKATELGYQVDPVMEALDNNQKLEIEIKLGGRVIDTKNISVEVWKKIKSLLTTMPDTALDPTMNALEGKKIKLISIKENLDNIATGTQGVITGHDAETDIVSVKWDSGQETALLPEDQFEVLPKITENFNSDIIDITDFVKTFYVGTPPTEQATRNWEQMMCKAISLLFKNDIPLAARTLIANGPKHTEWTQEDIEVYLSSICQTNENLVLNPEQGKAQLNGVETSTMSNTDATSQTKQPLEGEKEYSPNALINFINDNPFFKYSFHETSTDDMEKDLDKFFKHYVKGDEEAMKKYKVYEKYKNN